MSLKCVTLRRHTSLSLAWVFTPSACSIRYSFKVFLLNVQNWCTKTTCAHICFLQRACQSTVVLWGNGSRVWESLLMIACEGFYMAWSSYNTVVGILSLKFYLVHFQSFFCGVIAFSSRLSTDRIYVSSPPEKLARFRAATNHRKFKLLVKT